MPSKQTLVDCCVPVGHARLSDGQAEELERLFRSVADRHRLKVLSILADADDAVCVCAMVPELGLAQPTVSYHLKQLAEAGIVEREKRGTYAYYRLAPGALERLGGLLRGSEAAAGSP